MPKRKKRGVTTKKKKADEIEDAAEEEEIASSAKKVAASSTSLSEDDASQNSCFSSIGTSDGSLGFSSHFWCNYCEFSADTKQELITHMRQHMIKCSFCPFSSLSRAEVLRHVKSEHDDEEEVDSSSSTADHDMDKDPCCACIFCGFMTYSTECLEKHTASKHRGMLPKSVAKMISKSVSAKIRKADALFYSNLANEEAKANSPLDKELDISKSELPSSSNTITIEEEKEKFTDVKPRVSMIPALLSGHDALHSMSLDGIKSNSGNEEKTEKIDNGINQHSSNYKMSTDWNVKVETMYCLSCPYSNVAIDKLKCHTFSQHPRDAAVAKNNAGDSGHELLDVMFFCVKDTCNHSSNASVVYEDHIMNCCPLHQPLAEDVRERLRSTLKYLSNFHRQHGLKAAPGFIDFVSSFDKVNPPFASIMSHFSTSYSTGNVLSSQTMNNINTSASTQNNKGTMMVNADSFTQPNIQLVSESQQMSTAIVASNYVSTHAVPSAFNQQNAQHDLLDEIDKELPFRHPTQENNNAHNVGQSSLQSSDTLPCASIQPPNTTSLASYLRQQKKLVFSQPPVNEGNKRNIPPVLSQHPTAQPNHRNYDQKWNSGQNTFTTSSTSNESQQPNHGPSIIDNMYNPGQGQQPIVFENSGNAMNDSQSNSGNLSLNTRSLIHQQSAQLSCTESSKFNTAPFISNSNDQNLKVQPSPTFTSSVSFPATLTPQLSQQSIGPIVNQSMTGSAIGAPPNPPKMLDLLSDTYSILLDDDLDLAASLEDPITSAIPQQPSVSNAQGIVNASTAGVPSFPQVSMQQTPEPLLQESYSIQPSSMSYSSTLQQPATESIVSQPVVTQNVLSQQSSMSYPPPSFAEPTAAPLTLTLSHSSAPIVSSNSFKSHTATSFPNVSMSQNTNFEQSGTTANIQQSCTNERQYPVPSSQFPFHTSLPGPIDSSAPSQRQGDKLNTLQNQEHSSPSFEGQALLTVPKEIPQSQQMKSSSTEDQNLNPKSNYSEGNSSTFFETSSTSSATGPMHSWQGKQTTDVPNFLVPTSQNDQHQMDINQSDPNSDSNQDVQQSILLPSTGQSDSLISNQASPSKNQPLNAAKNFAGNSPLSPSIYLNGQAPRHSRSNWTSTDMMPPGATLPQIRARPPAPANFPNLGNVRQNLFPPQHYRGRGRPRGPRMQNYLRHPGPKTQDDDVIVTAFVRGAPSQQPVRAPLRRGAMRGPRQPLPRGPTRGMVRKPVGAPGPPNPKKPFDVSKHFVDLACVVNTGNEDDNEVGDDIQIMGVTPGHNASKGPPKAVDAKKFSFCCVHCGQDQGSKQVMKQHMKASHNDSLLGAFRNIETGQLLFFCPQLRCEFMSYDENRLTEHLFSCYNLDKSKQLPFDLQSALKNLRSLKIRKESTNTTLGKSQNNPIDLDGRGLRDNFNNNLTDAFDDMVENTIVRQTIRPNNNNSTEQIPNSAPNFPDERPPGYVQSMRGRPLSHVPRMPRPPLQHRQPQSYLSSLGQRGNPRMPPYQQSHRAPGRRNFRHHPPSGPMRSVRGDLAMRMGRPPMRGHPRNPQPFVPVQNLGNEGEPILIDIEPEVKESAPSSQNTSMPTYGQSEYASSAETMTSSHAAEAFSATNQAIMSVSPQTVTTPADVPYSSPLPYSVNENIEDVTQIEASSNINPQRPMTDDGAMNKKANPYAETGEIQSQVAETIIPETAPPPSLPPNNVQESRSDDQFAPQVISQDTTFGDDIHSVESNEEQVQAILLKKVFAKVPHMPKKLSQRLVLRFKEFAAKRGVVITPNSKVIDEFVERISYKGSNPLSKQHPSQQQQQQQQLSQQQHQQILQQQQQLPQQQSQSLQQQPQCSAIPKSSYESQQSSSSFPVQSHQSFSPKASGNKDSPMSASDSDHVTPAADMPHHQQFHKPSFSQHGNISTSPLSRLESENNISPQPQHLKEPSFSQNFDAPNSSQHTSEQKFSEHYETNTSQHQSQRQSGFAQYQNFSKNNSNVSQSQNQSTILPNLNQPNNSQGQLESNFPQTLNASNAYENQDQKSFIHNQNELEDNGNPGAGDQGKDEHEIIETKIILAERDLKFSGAFANIAKSVVDHSKKVVKEEGNWPPATVPGSSMVNAVSSVSYNEFSPVVTVTESLHSVSSTPLHYSQSSVDPLTDSRMSLPEQVTLNEKILKKEQVPLTFPMSKEGETILVQSSVDHLVSGNESLEVDIAGTPLYANTLFSHNVKSKGIKSTDWPCNVDVADEQKGQKICKDQEPVIDKTSGRILLKIKKGNLPRKQHDPLTTNVIPKIDEHDTNEQCIRRSERKRKVRQCDTDDDTLTELDNLLSDDDDDYHIESDDESYDEDCEYKRGDSSKKKSKVSEDPTAFNIKQKGSYVCWICFKSLASCLGVKRHINRKHAKALCAIIENEADDGIGKTQLQLLLFCPRNCSYATLEPDAFNQHIATCQKSEIVCDIQNLVEAQACFVTQEFAELQKDISSGAVLDDLKQKAGQVKTKRNRRPSSSSSRSSTEKLIETGYVSEIVPSPAQMGSMQFSNLPGP